MIMTREELNQDKQKKVMSEARYENRKKIVIFSFKLIGIIVLVFLAFYLYTSFISTKIVNMREYRIINKKLPNEFNGLKVVQISDLHYGTTFFINDLKKIVNKINEVKPDIVVFTGDLVDKSFSLANDEQENIINVLSKIDTTLGKYAIRGEEDNEAFSIIMNQSEFDILDNDYDFIYNESKSPIMIFGSASYLNDENNIKKTFAYFDDATHNSNIFSITLIHEPDLAEYIYNDYPVDLILAGHSHNGNIRLPFVGPVIRVDGANKFYNEHYKLGNSDLYISSGLGTNGAGFRLFCRPSISLFRISNK